MGLSGGYSFKLWHQWLLIWMKPLNLQGIMAEAASQLSLHVLPELSHPWALVLPYLNKFFMKKSSSQIL